MTKSAAILLAALLAAKVVLLMVFGPVFTPDSWGYVELAKTLLTSDAWLHDAALSSEPIPALAVRMIGYPAVIAAGMSISATHWPYLIVALQFALSLAAHWTLYRFALQVGLPHALSLFAVAAQATAIQVTIDQCILSDSLHASVLILAICLLLRGASGGQPLGLAGSGAVGVLFVLAFLLREALQFLVVSLLPLFAVRIVGVGRGKMLRSVAAGTLAVVPLFAAVEAWKSWNQYRTGERFVTTSAQVNMPLALAQAARRDPGVFAGDTPLDVAARRVFRNYTQSEAAEVNRILFDQGYRAPEMARMGVAHFAATWRERPMTMLGVIGDSTRKGILKVAFRPVGAVCETAEWATGERRCRAFRDAVRAARAGFAGADMIELLLLPFQGAERIVSVALLGLFLVGVPALSIASLRHGLTERRTLVMTALWATYVGWYLIYAAVHFEVRYQAPLIPFSLICGLAVPGVVRRQRPAV
jgi:hypothetical protein